jgi:hypothetical protein
MEYVFTGFRQDRNFRRYAFQAVAADRTRTDVSVSADVASILKHKIPLQELPLLCRRFLEGNVDGVTGNDLLFTEKDMLVYASDRAAAAELAASKRKSHVPPRPNGSSIEEKPK